MRTYWDKLCHWLFQVGNLPGIHFRSYFVVSVLIYNFISLCFSFPPPFRLYGEAVLWVWLFLIYPGMPISLTLWVYSNIMQNVLTVYSTILGGIILAQLFGCAAFDLATNIRARMFRQGTRALRIYGNCSEVFHDGMFCLICLKYYLTRWMKGTWTSFILLVKFHKMSVDYYTYNKSSDTLMS